MVFLPKEEDERKKNKEREFIPEKYKGNRLSELECAIKNLKVAAWIYFWNTIRKILFISSTWLFLSPRKFFFIYFCQWTINFHRAYIQEEWEFMQISYKREWKKADTQWWQVEVKKSMCTSLKLIFKCFQHWTIGGGILLVGAKHGGTLVFLHSLLHFSLFWICHTLNEVIDREGK